MDKKVYNLGNLGNMLIEMGEYLNENWRENWEYSQDFADGLFDKLAQTGLFHDACGEIVSQMENSVVVATDY